MSLADVRVEMAAVVDTAAPRLNVYSYDNVEPVLPAALVTWDTPISFQGGTADGALRFDLVVRLIVGKADQLLSSQSLDGLIGSVIPDAISAHSGVSWKTANPTSISAPAALADSAVVVELTVAMHATIN